MQATPITVASREPIRFERRGKMNWKAKSPCLDASGTCANVDRRRVAVLRDPTKRSAVNPRHMVKALVPRDCSRALLLTARAPTEDRPGERRCRVTQAAGRGE